MSDRSSATRARQACEPCRRKKTKCPGEKPTCSFCARLGQRCSYERGDEVSARVHKSRRSDSHDSAGSKERLQRLESRVEEVFGIISHLTAPTVAAVLPSLPSAAHSAERTTATTRSQTPTQRSPNTGTADSPKFDAVLSHDPPDTVWPKLIGVYKEKFHCQPLTVLGPQALSVSPTKWPKCLRHSFLALTLPLADDSDFFSGVKESALLFYAASARRDIFNGIVDGQVNIELLQALCLSTLTEIAGLTCTDSNPLAAWMNIGAGIRLALSTKIMSCKHDYLVPDQDVRRRCCWSLFVLDRIYGSTLNMPPALNSEDDMPEYPQSSPCPNPLTESNPQVVQMLTMKDLGVVANYLQMLSIWGLAVKYVRSIKDGQIEDAWSTGSQYQQVVARLFDLETGFAQIHRFQQARMQERDPDSLNAQRDYWAPWLSGQFLFHAVQGFINHPFLHIASRPRRQAFQPPSFLQNSVDQAVLHCSWVLKCIEVCNDTGFVINDPFMAHLVAVTATIYLFLLNAKDSDLASQAQLGFERCYTFIQSMTSQWKHLKHTVSTKNRHTDSNNSSLYCQIDKLDILRHAAISSSSLPANASAPKAQRSLLWELLDYSASTTPSRVPEFASDAVDLNVDTRFLSPPKPLASSHTPATIVQHDRSHQHNSFEQTIGQGDWDPAADSFDFNLFDNEQMADLTNLTFGRDLWSFGQL